MKEQKEPLFMVKGAEDNIGNMFFVVSSKNQSGETVVKHVSYEQLMKILSSSYRVIGEERRIGIVPDGYLDAKIRDSSWIVRLYVPEKRRCLLLANDTPIPTGFMIPMPAMLFEIMCDGSRSGGWLNGKCCVVNGTYEEIKDAYMHNGLKQYLYPFGNVSRGGNICMGNIRIQVSKMAEASKYVEAFFNGITNADFADTGRLKNGWGQMRFLGQLQKMEHFPYELLVEKQILTDW